MFAGYWSVVVTLAQANRMVARLDSPQVGVPVVVHHVCRDPHIYARIAAAFSHTPGFHNSDSRAPPTDVLPPAK
jgi:hypothetical protein